MKRILFNGRYLYNTTIGDQPIVTIAPISELLGYDTRCVLLDIASNKTKKQYQNLKCIADNIRIIPIHDMICSLLQLIPELVNCVYCDQNNPYHYLDVFKHMVLSCMMCDNHAHSETKVALLLHDIGKPMCYTVDEKGIGHFYNHANRSAEIALSILQRLNFNIKDIHGITTLIKYHDRQINTEKSIKKVLSEIGTDLFDNLLYMKSADIMAQTPKYSEQRLEELNKIRNKYEEIRMNIGIFSIKQLDITGNDIIEHFNVQQGKIVGIYLSKALEFVKCDTSKNNKKDILYYLETLKL